MGTYRTYANGIENARRYKGYYIVREMEPIKSFKVLTEDKVTIADQLASADEGIWEITKLLLNEDFKTLAKKYAEMDMFHINKMFIDMSKDNQQGLLGPIDVKRLELLEIIRSRRLKDLPVDL